MPIFVFMYIISRHSTELINERISIFSLIMIVILSFLLPIGVIREIKSFKIKKKRVLKGFLATAYILNFILAYFLLYGNINFKYFIIEKAMLTNHHQYLATWFYNSNTIDDVVIQLKNKSPIDTNGTNKLNFDGMPEIETVYANKYEESILNNQKSLYKKINIQDTNYSGYLIAIYDPSKIELKTENTSEIDNINILTIKNNKLHIESNSTYHANYIQYKEVILASGKKENQENKYNNETIIGQRDDGIILILNLEIKDNLKNKDITKILENYNIKNAVISMGSNKIELSSTRIVVK